MVCSHSDETHDLLFHIVDRDVTSLLGLPDTLRLKLLQLSPKVFEVKTVSKTADTEFPEFTQYVDLFDGKLNKLLVKYKMTVDNNVAPVVRAARKLPVAMKTRIKSELDSMEKQGVFAVTKFRQYIYGKSVTVETDHSPLVTIMKRPIAQAPASLQ